MIMPLVCRGCPFIELVEREGKPPLWRCKKGECVKLGAEFESRAMKLYRDIMEE